MHASLLNEEDVDNIPNNTYTYSAPRYHCKNEFCSSIKLSYILLTLQPQLHLVHKKNFLLLLLNYSSFYHYLLLATFLLLLIMRSISLRLSSWLSLISSGFCAQVSYIPPNPLDVIHLHSTLDPGLSVSYKEVSCHHFS
jgi:hypothetical protein